MTTLPKLSKRLQCAADLVREGSFLADVGTDHAYLPVVLAATGKIRGGIASDIHKGPIERARANVKAWGLEETLSTMLCDGLCGIEPHNPDDILILGMGGELIADILARAPWTKKEGVRLILQPMTHAELLRAFLLENGYGIVREVLVKEDKIYQIICAEYTGKTENYTAAELAFGKETLCRMDETARELLLHWQSILARRIEGKEKAGADASEEMKLKKEIEAWLS